MQLARVIRLSVNKSYQFIILKVRDTTRARAQPCLRYTYSPVIYTSKVADSAIVRGGAYKHPPKYDEIIVSDTCPT